MRQGDTQLHLIVGLHREIEKAPVVYIYLVCVNALSAIDVAVSSQVRCILTEFLSGLQLSARCSGTMTSILLDISVEIRIFLKKGISHRRGFRLISLSRSNRVRLMFGYTGVRVTGL